MKATRCGIPGCGNKHEARGWCNRHYLRWWKHGDPLTPGRDRTDAERFWAMVQKTSTCWLWTGSLKVEGYGHFRADGGMWRAHRWAYENGVGPIPAGLTLDHLCRVRACVRPSHLEPVTQGENNRRGRLARRRDAALLKKGR